MLQPTCFAFYCFKLATVHYLHFYNITNLMTYYIIPHIRTKYLKTFFSAIIGNLPNIFNYPQELKIRGKAKWDVEEECLSLLWEDHI